MMTMMMTMMPMTTHDGQFMIVNVKGLDNNFLLLRAYN